MPSDSHFRLDDQPDAGREARGWHGAWVVAGGLAAGIFALGGADPTIVAATMIGAAPGAVGLTAPRGASRGFRPRLIGLWSLAAALPILITGGLAGPFAALALMPLAVATVFGGRQSLAAGAAAVALVAAVAALGQAAGWLAVAPRAPWLAFFALAMVGASFAWALAIAGRRASNWGERQETARRRAELFLAAQPLLIMRLAPTGEILESLGAIPQPLTVKDFANGFASLGGSRDALEEAVASAMGDGRAEVAFAPAGTADRWVAAVISRHGDTLIASLRDASAERMRELKLEQAAKEAEALNAGKSRFLANMSHELRTPLNAIVGFSDIMRSQMFGPMSQKYAEYSSLIHESGGHLLDLINDVLDLSKIEAQRYELSRETFDAREAVAGALRLVRVQADGAGVRLRGALPPAEVRVDADRRAMKQIVLNLLSNALKFTPGGGMVDVALSAQGSDLVITVSDTGVGIAPQDLERLGNPYEQGGPADQKAMGTGLGLSLVRAFAELHGGAMSIASTLGDGTEVTVRLPVVLPPRLIEAPARGAAPLGDNVIAFTPHR